MHDIKNLKPKGNGLYEQGYIDPASCKKLFKSQENKRIIYRSSWEKKFIYWLENCKTIKNWGSECICIPYYSVLDDKIHHYYPDYFIVTDDDDRWLIEIKPSLQTQKPVNEENKWGMREYIRNRCKWKAAKEWCDANDIKFKILTEKTINSL